MNLTDIINQLNSIKASSAAFADTDPDSLKVLTPDIDALTSAIEMLTAMRDTKIETADELKDILDDYKKQALQLKILQRKFTKAARPAKKGDIWICPECGHKITPNHGHCHWCGKKLGGW